jgi:hypothetical protein
MGATMNSFLRLQRGAGIRSPRFYRISLAAARYSEPTAALAFWRCVSSARRRDERHNCSGLSGSIPPDTMAT